MIREGRTGIGQLYTGLLAVVYDRLRTARHGVEADEISTVRLRPLTDTETPELLLEDALYGLELRTDDIRMLAHMLDHAMDILEEAYMTKLIYLIIADGLVLHLVTDIIEVVRARRERCEAGTREGDLRGRGKLINHIRITRALTLSEDLDEVILVLIIEVMYTVGVVPVNTEVTCSRLETCETTYGLIAVAVALRVGVLRDAPDALDGVVFLHELLDHVHIRTGRRHRNIDHLDAEVLGDTEVTVVARYRTEPLHLIKLTPWCGAHNAVGHRSRNGIIHDIQ